jgi:hypothetical protein
MPKRVRKAKIRKEPAVYEECTTEGLKKKKRACCRLGARRILLAVVVVVVADVGEPTTRVYVRLHEGVEHSVCCTRLDAVNWNSSQPAGTVRANVDGQEYTRIE